MRNIQEIFDTVIQKGFYGRGGSQFMCNALIRAHGRGFLTSREMELARAAIHRYMAALAQEYGWAASSLSLCLHIAGLKCDRDATLSIYRNWSKRPYPETRCAEPCGAAKAAVGLR